MKKIHLLSASFFSILAFAQTGTDNMAVSAQGEMFFMMGKKNVSSDNNIDGTPYADGDKFVKVKIPNYNKPIQDMRYNVYADEMEFRNGIDTYFLNKQPLIKIEFPSLKKTYECINYTFNEKTYLGYLVVLAEGSKYSLYKKESMEILKGEKAANPFVKDQNDFYSKVKSYYLLKKGNRFIKLSKNTKDVSSAFDNPSSIEDFIKTNKINLSKEDDLIKLINFTNN